MKIMDERKEIMDLELEIANCEALACDPDCKKRNTYLYRMWSATHRLLKLTKPNPNEKEYNDRAPYPHLDEDGDNITVGDVVMDGSTVGSKVICLQDGRS